MKIILGSKSPYRRKILSQMGYEFTVLDPDVDEKAIRHEDPKKLVLILAQAKADALLSKITKPAILITSDQIVISNNQILEKPKDKAEAKKFLRMHSKYHAQTITAITVTNTENKKQISDVDISTIWFEHIPEDIIEKIVEKEAILTCAGGFSVDGPILNKYVAKIDGTIESISGLPIEMTEKLIEKAKDRRKS